MRESVQWFAEQMETTLKKNDHKGGWEDCDNDYLIELLFQEVNELYHAIEAPSDNYTQNIINEATDVANFAMMIADRAREMVNAKEATT